MVRLHIDSTREDASFLILYDNNGDEVAQKRVPDDLNESLLPHIAELIEKNAGWDAIDEISVSEGPGTRFTRTRLGVAYANALGLALGIDVNGKEFALPKYSKAPNITV